MNNFSLSGNLTSKSNFLLSTEKRLTTEMSPLTTSKPISINRIEEEECFSQKKHVYNIRAIFKSANTKKHRIDETILITNDDNELSELKRNCRGFSHKGFKILEDSLRNEVDPNKNIRGFLPNINQDTQTDGQVKDLINNSFSTQGNMLGDNNDNSKAKRGLTLSSSIKGRRESVLKMRVPFLPKKNKSQIDPQSYNKIVSQAEKATAYGLALKRIRNVDIILGIFVTANIVLTLIDNEVYYSQTDQFIDDRIRENELSESVGMNLYMQERVISPLENTLRGINLVFVICILFLVYLHYYFSAKMLQSQGLLSKYEGIYCAGLLKPLLIEMGILCIVYPPYCNVFIHGKMLGLDYCYNLNSIICIFVTFKSYIILRVYTYFSKWTNDTAKCLCNKAHVNPGVRFAVKAELKKRPYTMLALIYGSVILILAFALRTFEYYVITKDDDFSSSNKEVSEISLSNFRSLTTSIWLILITMTTVGYGDYVPKSHYGRFICIISCIIGLLLVSLVVVSLAIVTDFSEEEKKAYSLIKKISADQNVVDKAYEVIKCFLHFRKMVVKKGSHKLSRGFILITQLKNAISAFKNDSKLAKSMSLPLDKTFKIIQHNFFQDYRLLNANINKLSNIDSVFKRLSTSQRECTEIFKIVQERELRLGEYLIKLNNTLFKHAILKYKDHAPGHGKTMVNKSTMVKFCN